VNQERYAFDALLGEGAAADVLRAVLDGVEDGIVACDASGVLRYFNRATRRMHGLPEEALPHEHWAEHYRLFHADGTTPLRPEEIPLLRALREGRVEGAEIVIVPRQGPARHIVAGGRAIYGSGGAVLGAVVSMHEVTERKVLETAREHVQLAQLAAVLASVSDGIVAADAKGNVVEWNAAALAMHGFHSLAEAQRQLGEFDATFELRTGAGELLPLDRVQVAGELGERVQGPLDRLDVAGPRGQGLVEVGAWARENVDDPIPVGQRPAEPDLQGHRDLAGRGIGITGVEPPQGLRPRLHGREGGDGIRAAGLWGAHVGHYGDEAHGHRCDRVRQLGRVLLDGDVPAHEVVDGAADLLAHGPAQKQEDGG